MRCRWCGCAENEQHDTVKHAEAGTLDTRSWVEVCAQCEERPADGDYGMCASCLHDALRSGWEPGK